jgi:hypothetical protein
MSSLFLSTKNMSNIIVGNGSTPRGGTLTAITAVALILILMASPVILSKTATEAFAAPLNLKSKKDCEHIQFQRLTTHGTTTTDSAITISTSKHKYSVQVDYSYDSGTFDVVYYKNVGAKDPRGPVVFPAGKTITITFETTETISKVNKIVTLYDHNVSDCDILLFGHVKDSDKLDLKILNVEQTPGSPSWLLNTKLTVQVPDASDVPKHFTKLGIQVETSPESRDFYLISNGVHVR